MRVYYDPADGRILFTLTGVATPPGTWIEVEDQDLGDLNGWRVAEGELARYEGWYADRLSAVRAETELDKADLLNRLADYEILTDEEVEEAARGFIPARLASLLTNLDPASQRAARVKWAADARISRMHPLIVLAAYALGLSDALLDQIFGVEVPA